MTMKGTVIGNKMQKTVVVEIINKVAHPMYKKYVNRKTKVYAHTESPLDAGATVVVQESKPISALKRWIVVDVVNTDKK